LEIAFQHPTIFASVGGHSAALIDSYAGPAINPRYTGLSRDLGDLRIYLDAGRRDPYVTHVRQLHEDMAAANIPHTWVMNEGTHEETYWVEHLTAYLTWYSTPWSPDRNSYPPCQTS
jgi:enterochelin esterase-like enzyme